MVYAGQRQIDFTRSAEVDEVEQAIPIAKLAPRPRPLAKAAITVHPDVEPLIRFGGSVQLSSPHEPTCEMSLTFLKKFLK